MEAMSTHACMERKGKRGIVYIALYVDYNVMVGDVEAVVAFKENSCS